MDYFISTSSVNAALSVVLPGAEAMTYMIGWIMVSYSAVPSAGRLMIFTGTTSIFDYDIFVQNPTPIVFQEGNPLPTVQGDSLEIRLAAGGLQNTGKINAFAYSRY